MTSFLYTRHSLKAAKAPKHDAEMASSQYAGLSKAGVELAKTRALEIREILENAAPGTVLFLSGVTEEARTESTMKAYFDALRECGITAFDGTNCTNEEITAQVELIDAKCVVYRPVFMPKLGMIGRFTTEDGKWNDWTLELLAKHDNNASAAIADWIQSNGMLTTKNGNVLAGPNPQQVADEQHQALVELSNEAHDLFGDRPAIVVATGHSYNVDVLRVALANNGVVSLEGWNEIGTILPETGMIVA